ncbi:nitrous oxide reductase family maturation protein NosD [Thermoplasmatota archaeon]
MFIYNIGGSEIKKILPIIIIILLVSSFSNISIGEFTNNIIYVDDDGSADYTRIQDAIDNSTDGDTIFVYNGTYYENIIIDKSINLIGENKESTSIIADSNTSNVIGIKINNVSVSNLTINGEAVSCGISITSDYTIISDNHISSRNGIHINSGNNTIIRNYIGGEGFWAIDLYPKSSFNKIIDNTLIAASTGMYLLDSCRNNSIINNTIICNNSGIRLHTSNKNIIADNDIFKGGLQLQDSYDNYVYNNSVNGKSLCYLEDVSDSIINQDFGQIIIIDCENIIIENQSIIDLRTGIHIYSSKNCIIQNNIITHNNPVRGDGIQVVSCENTQIINNNISNLDAMDIRYSNDTIISYNNIFNCRTGIFLKYCDKIEILKNIFVNNSLHIDFYFGSRNSIITMNNLIGHRIPSAFFCDPIDANNTWHNNYWGRPKIFPKLIIGQLIIKEGPFPSTRFWIKFDWHPAIKPFDIPHI